MDIADGGLVFFALCIPFFTTTAMVYMTLIYERSKEPRSWYFRMLIITGWLKWIAGGWFGYTLLARVYSFPMPPPDIARMVGTVAVIFLFLPPIYFAYEIYQSRRRATHASEMDTAGHSLT